MGPHRADIRTPGGLVVEIQHSGISSEDVAAREAFYGNMVWLLDGRNFVLKQRRFGPICGQFAIARALTNGRASQDVLNKLYEDQKNLLIVEDPHWSFGTNRRTFQVSTKPIAFDLGDFLVVCDGLRLWTKGRSPRLYLQDPTKVTTEAFTSWLMTAGVSSPPT